MNQLDISLSIEHPGWQDRVPDLEQVVERAVMAGWNAAATESGLTARNKAEVSILLADDPTLRDLNRTYRGQDKPTNVLSFAFGDTDDAPAPPDAPWLLGDLALAFETVAGEADQQNKRLSDHFTHLVVHGMLHLLGYDHIDASDADRMEGLETTILAGLGISDPYGHSQLEGELNRESDVGP